MDCTTTISVHQYSMLSLCVIVVLDLTVEDALIDGEKSVSRVKGKERAKELQVKS